MLRNFLSILLVSLITFGLFLHDAEAKRFGGGRSFGFSRSTSSFSRPASFGRQNFSQPANRTASSMSRWLGPLAGLAAGGLLASLFMNHGIGSGILSWLLVGGFIFLLIKLFRRMSPTPHYARENNNFARQQSASQFMHNNIENHQRSYAAPVNNYPVEFDDQAFLRDAKVQFIRLQAAYDQKNLNDIREFTSPEVFAEIQIQFQERGNAENKTNVISLETELLGVEYETHKIDGTEMQSMVASVRFNGMIQEDAHHAANAVNEVWHFRKELGSVRWIVIGVQQA